MKISVVRAEQLTGTQIAAWAAIQEAEPALESPYFRPEFTQLVAAAKGGVEVAVLEDGGTPAGFFPFERDRSRIGRPVGWPMCDYQGVVARAGLAWDAARLVRACGLSAWDFDHVPAGQSGFGPHARGTTGSPYLDLSAGYEAYKDGRKRAGTDLVRRTAQSVRRLEREVGRIRFEYHTGDPTVFAKLLAWKRDQYHRTGARDIFALAWPVRLLEAVLAATAPTFQGVVSALYAGDRLAAIELGIRSGGVLHSWFPAYDTELRRFSPGMIHQFELARAAAADGVRRIDLGKGDEEYKLRLMSGAVPLIEGSVAVTARTRLLRGGWYRARDWAKTSRFAGPVRTAARVTRPLREWLSFR